MISGHYGRNFPARGTFFRQILKHFSESLNIIEKSYVSISPNIKAPWSTEFPRGPKISFFRFLGDFGRFSRILVKLWAQIYLRRYWMVLHETPAILKSSMRRKTLVFQKIDFGWCLGSHGEAKIRDFGKNRKIKIFAIFQIFCVSLYFGFANVGQNRFSEKPKFFYASSSSNWREFRAKPSSSGGAI